MFDESRFRPGSGSTREAEVRIETFVDPGAVTLLALINDRDHEVEPIIDEELWKQEAFQFHPLANTSTLVVSRDNLQHFLDLTGHEAKLLNVPEQQ